MEVTLHSSGSQVKSKSVPVHLLGKTLNTNGRLNGESANLTSSYSS